MEMFKEKGAEKKVQPVDKVREFCKNFETANIVSLPDGSFFVERLDERQEQEGVYGFSADGELIDFSLGSGPSNLDKVIDKLESLGQKAEVIEIKKNNEGKG